MSTPLPPPARAPDTRLLWLAGFAAWTALTFLSISETALSLAYRGEPVHWGTLIAWRAIDWYTCALFVPPFLWLVRRAPLERRTWKRRAPLYVAVTLAATFAKYAVLVPIQRELFDADRTFGAVLAGNAITELMTYWAVVGVLHALEFYRRYREREALALQLRAELGEAQLRALRAQLNPHFLFNTLNAATALLHRDPDAADAMLTRLGELLRLTLRDGPGHETRLRDELALLERYLEIMRVRFADQLTVTCRVPAELEDAMVPTFVLQPLVENALEHGVARLDGPGHVEIAARREGESLVLAVRDDGPGGAAGSGDGDGIGLSNTRGRLAQLYGAGAVLALRRAAEGGTEAELRLPLRRAVA
jgi:two-component system, LytTR family, sensor kinase